MSDDRRTALRRSTMGFVYQYHHLLPEFSALENVVVPQMIAGKSRKAARPRATELLTRVGLAARLEHGRGALAALGTTCSSPTSRARPAIRAYRKHSPP
jgi:lipoprotein-releasing system ATP-binding protein